MPVTLNDILSKLEGVKGRDGKYMACCPCHRDSTPSLSVGMGKDGKIVLKCFAGCSTEDIVWSMNLQMKDLFADVAPATAFPVYEEPQRKQTATEKPKKEAEYLYAGGQLKKIKYRRSDGSKYCTWLHKEADGSWAKGRNGIAPGLYMSRPELLDGIFLVEGEKDADTIEKALGLPAVSLPDGSQSKWDPAYDAVFQGKRFVWILPDNDEPGQKYAQMCAANIYGKAEKVCILDLKDAWPDIPPKGDITDMIVQFGPNTAFSMIGELDKVKAPWEPPVGEQKQAEAKPKFTIISARDLQNADLPPVRFLVEGMLPEGTSLVSAASKIGKSWMVLDMGLSIAAGKPFMGHETHKCGVLYLALEDSLNRLQDRMNKILQGESAPEQFYFMTEAPKLDNGLLDMLDDHFKVHPDTKMVIIDTLQKIRGQALPRESAYAQDYREMETLKAFFDKRNIALQLVHHNRKMVDDNDPFNMISGTNGIMGAADTIWTITKKRADQEATLHITGRDVPQSDTIIRFEKESWKWKSVGSADWINEQRAKLEYDGSPIVKTIRELLRQSKDSEWKGTAKDLLAEGRRICKQPISVSAQKLGYELRELDAQLLRRDGIVHKKSKNGNAGNTHIFYFQSWTDEADQQEELPL